MNDDALYQAVTSRDRRFEGRFVLGVKTTGVYCRPGCPAPLPKRQNCRFFPCAAAAEDEGFRPCRRCRPETSPGSPAWLGTTATATRALRLILDGALDGDTEDALAARLGVSPRHLRRVFKDEFGATPGSVARTRRVHFARQLVDETPLPLAQVAYAAGFGSVRRFNHEFKETFRLAPRDLRGEDAAPSAGALVLRLPFRPPMDHAGLLDFLSARALRGVEEVVAATYRRAVALGEDEGVVTVSFAAERHARVEVPLALSTHVREIVARVTRLFDLSADPLEIGTHLSRDPFLAPALARRPGLRVPGAWDGFETAVRGVLGQQISVKGATTLAARLVERFGRKLASPAAGLTSVFPTPDALAEADLVSVGLTSARAKTLRALSNAVATGDVRLHPTADPVATERALLELPGIGPWTAQYVALRVFGQPDAFPAGDLGVRKALGDGSPVPEAEALARAEAWRPFRAYAALHLWSLQAPGSEVRKRPVDGPEKGHVDPAR